MILGPSENSGYAMHFTLAFPTLFNDPATKSKKQRYKAANESNNCAVF